MSLCAVLGAVASTRDARERAHACGAVDLVVQCLASHDTHNGFRTWACGCLSNLLLHESAQQRFRERGGLPLLIAAIKVRMSLMFDYDRLGVFLSLICGN